MGRTVLTVRNAPMTTYVDVTQLQDEWEWQDFCEDLNNAVMEVAPKCTPVEKWFHNEIRAFLGNGLGCFTISEYCGVAAIQFVAEDGKETLAEQWVSQIEPKLSTLLDTFGFKLYTKGGTASSGEAFYNRRAM